MCFNKGNTRINFTRVQTSGMFPKLCCQASASWGIERHCKHSLTVCLSTPSLSYPPPPESDTKTWKTCQVHVHSCPDQPESKMSHTWFSFGKLHAASQTSYGLSCTVHHLWPPPPRNHTEAKQSSTDLKTTWPLAPPPPPPPSLSLLVQVFANF